MASRQSVSSILKPPKVRAPLKEIESVEQDADENTATLAKRKVSFSGMNKIKMYNTGATSLTVHQAPMFDEQISMLSDSSNAEKPKLSGKFEKSDAQISIESTNCTNLEDNGRIIIEYESPNDNMEMTEALSGKILSDTIYTIDNNGSEHISYSSDYSENNMEFTEALQGGLILSGDNSCNSLSSTEISETLDEESYDELVCQSGLKPSKPLSDVLIINPLNTSSSSSCMDFTCANTKSNLLYNTQSNNMELTEQMTSKSSKSIWSNDDYKSLSMELTQLPDRQTFEDNCELVYEHNQHSVSMRSDISCETQENHNYELEIVQSEKLEKNNFNSQTIGCVLNNSDNGETFIEELSSSMVSMDIDPTLEGNEFDISYVNVDNPLIIENKQNNSTIPVVVGIEDSVNPEKNVLDNYSNVIEISNENSESRLSIFPTGSSFVVNMSPENNLDNYFEVEELHQTLHGHTSVLDQNQYLENKSIIVEKHVPKKYSRKTMIHPCPLIVQGKSHENEDTPEVVNSNEHKYDSRKSIAPTTVFNGYISGTSEKLEEEQQEKYSKQSITPMSPFYQTQSLETENLSDTSGIVEDNKKIQYSRKSVAPTFVFNEDVLDTSETLEENQQQKCSLQSIAMTVFNETQSLETENLSDTSGIVKENQQNKYSRKSVAPTSVLNEDFLDTSETFEENQQQKCSLQSIAMSVLSQTQSFETKGVSNTSVYNPTELAEKCDTSECSFTQSAEKEETSLYNSTQSAEKDETSLYNSTQSAEMEDTSAVVEKYELKKYSRKSLGPTSLAFTHCESLDNSTLNNSSDTEENNEQTSEKAMSPVIPVTVNNLSILQSDVSSYDEEKSIAKSKHQSVLLNVISDDNLNSPFRKKQKKSIVPTHLIRLPIEDPSITNELETTDENVSGNFENVSKMDISIENEFKNDNELLVVSKESEECYKNIVHDDMLETNKENIVLALNELEINKTNLNELVENNDIFRESENKNEENNVNASIKVADNHILNSDYHSHSYSDDKTTKTICVKDRSNISTDETFQNNEKSCLVNRKRSYSNRDCAPLSCSSFMSKPNIHNSMEEDLNTDDFIQQSPIKNDIINKSLISEQLEINNELQVGLIKKESIKENLCNEALEFLTRWNEQFIEKKLVLDKCTNREWIFNLLDNNILLTVTYAYISNDYTFLKVEDISFTAKTITKNEIIKFGINWILSKYNPKVYKQICFTSRDVELLLKSLLEDVHFISKVMINMSYVRDLYCVTFKDNKAQFVIHNMNGPLMVRIEITLSNIHKLSVKDLSVDCLFGNFNTQLLEEIMEDISKDSNVLQSLVEKLTKLYSHRQN
ncbi:protein PF14_0175-like [Myzus persicae]|uniref:protein PF14_0175-like n=1 Tax=Myzus persicae TaxID=13164 RepID=UPI000B9365D8|nr:protein PF14_0175-like [Myzus persicae]